MIDFIPIDSQNKHIIEYWLSNDEAGKNELSFHQDVNEWFNSANSTPRYKWLLFKPTNPFGFIDLETYQDGSGFFTFYIAPSQRGRGFGKKALQELISKARKLHVTELFAGVNGTNKAGQKVLKSVGFTAGEKDKDNYIIFMKTIDLF